MNQMTVSRRFRLYILDLFVVCASYWLVWMLWMYSKGASLHDSQQLVLDVAWKIIVILAIYHGVFILLGTNRTIWRYAGGGELLRLFYATCVAGMLSWEILELLSISPIPAVFHLVAFLLSASALVLSRVVYVVFVSKRVKLDKATNAKRLLIVGAGEAGVKIADELRGTYRTGINPVGFVDDDMQKLKRNIHGLCVLGKISDIEQVCLDNSIDIVFIAIPSASNERIAEVLEECLKTDCVVKTLPHYSEIADGGSISRSVRDIKPEELLGREPIKVANETIFSFVKDKTIAITGGGGSIGSEICRQIAAHWPKRLIIIDVYENNAYAIQQELIGKYGDALDLTVYIATVCDFQKIDQLFALEKPDVVIHAAAHKHVPLMETVPDEAVKNNVYGTLNTVMAARKNKVGRFILISTDKAVNPTNIMGATKRVCEMIIQYADSISDDTTFAAVRFGNVLASNGSVIPLFQDQIEHRMDVTVTHPDIIRYFMIIPEAAQLVLTASAMAKGGEIFVLDMGEPVRIDDVARKMIRLAGLEIGKDINIRYTGLRPGEKLYEELLMGEEGLKRTQSEKIFVGGPIAMDYSRFKRELDEMDALVHRDDVTNEDVEQKLMEVVPTFKRAEPQPLPAGCEQGVPA